MARPEPMDEALLIAELRRDEDVRRFPYDDKTGKAPKAVGKVSIGVGRNLTDVGLSSDEIDYLLRNDVRRVVAELDERQPWWREMSPVRQRVLANMVFNMGYPRLAGFRKALAAMKAGQWSAASREMLDSDWSKQVGLRADRLAKMMRTGIG